MVSFIDHVRLLTGQRAPLSSANFVPVHDKTLFGGGGLDYSQFNELLLTLGYDRITRAFFNHFFIPPGKRKRINDIDKDTPFRIESATGFQTAVEEYRKFAMFKYGNFQFAFKTLSSMNSESISSVLAEYLPISEEVYEKRPVPLIDLDEIKREDTYLLGYIAGSQVKGLQEKKERGEPLAEAERSLIDRRALAMSQGVRNYRKYLTDDYMDVYIATSMRRKEDFFAVYDFVKGVFSHQLIKSLNLRHFDPTQADPQDKLAKGLIEGLMVKRAKCTIYCAQESDTFGKDSELAATLAQGKPVIAYVPKITDLAEYQGHLKKMVRECAETNEGAYLRDILFDRHPRCVQDKPEILEANISYEAMIQELASRDQGLYDERGQILHEIHPLSLQINLQTGVANGVIVVRSVDECAQILRGIVLRNLEFSIDSVKAGEAGTDSYVLREKLTGSVFRVVTGDPLLTNSFWNFYPEKEPE